MINQDTASTIVRRARPAGTSAPATTSSGKPVPAPTGNHGTRGGGGATVKK